MTELAAALTDYLTLRRSLGYKLERAAQVLASFVAHLDLAGCDHVSVETAVAWATLPANPDSPWRAQRLGIVRSFARYLHALDPAHEIPPPGLIPPGPGRPVPFLYSDEDVVALMAAARGVRNPLRAATLETVVGLLAVSGLRVGEVIRLDCNDVDVEQGALTVRNSKAGRSRVVPLHPSTVEALRAYGARRDELFPKPSAPSFFISSTGTRLRSGSLRQAFGEVLPAAGLPPRIGRCGPRLGGLRHSLHRVDHGRLAPRWRRGRAQPAAAVDLPRAREPCFDVLVSLGLPPSAGSSCRPAREHHRQGEAVTALAPTLEAFFTERLVRQRHASPHTIASYRDAFRLLLLFVQDAAGTPPAKLAIEDLDAPLVGAFLDHLEVRRGVVVATRNARLAAIHSLFRFAALQHPEHAGLIQRVLAIPSKRTDHPDISYLTRTEIDALLAAPDLTTRLGRRDRAMLAVAVQTGLRASELVGLRRRDISLGTGAHLTCTGKGRKQRTTPLTAGVAAVVGTWLRERGGEADDAVFPGPRGEHLGRDALRRIVARHVTTAATSCPSLAAKRVAPHVLRHTCAMQLLEAGVDVAVIALWLGHESIRTTDIYQHADLRMKEQALARTAPRRTPAGRYRPPDPLLAFLEGL